MSNMVNGIYDIPQWKVDLVIWACQEAEHDTKYRISMYIWEKKYRWVSPSAVNSIMMNSRRNDNAYGGYWALMKAGVRRRKYAFIRDETRLDLDTAAELIDGRSYNLEHIIRISKSLMFIVRKLADRCADRDTRLHFEQFINWIDMGIQCLEKTRDKKKAA